MEIVQLSDIHVGAQFREAIFDQVIEEVNSLEPDAVIITSSMFEFFLLFKRLQIEKCSESIGINSVLNFFNFF